jgi:uncharacterized protein
MSGGSWPKVILDPVHNLIPFEDNACDRLLWDLINTKEFQRLRRIKQLGVSEIVFPGANHSRFAHSIGVMHTARSFLVKIRQVQPNSLNEDLETLVLAAALIHDVGHGPFSHAFESITGDRHESRTLEIIRDESTEIHQCLKSYKAERDLPMKISLFFDESIESDQLTAADVPPFLTQIVSSQLDADRFDYLQRDSHATGAEYGKFDVRWLIHHLNLDHQRGRFYLSAKALTAAEIYVFARYHMYRSVYFHKTTRAAEVMLRLIFKRIKKLVEQAGSICAAQAILPEAPASVLTAFSARPTLSQYLALDDHSMTEFFKACAAANDQLLRELGDGLLNRKLYKAVDVTDVPPQAVANFKVEVVDEIRNRGLDAEYALVDDSPSDTPYKPYDPDAEKPASQIYIDTFKPSRQEISQVSDSIVTLKKKYSLLRYYFPERLREKVVSIAAKCAK